MCDTSEYTSVKTDGFFLLLRFYVKSIFDQALDFEFLANFDIFKRVIFTKIKASKMVKMAVFVTFCNQPKLISRKI